MSGAGSRRPAGVRVADGSQARQNALDVPPLPRTYVARHRLWNRLDDASTDAVTLLVAPAGAGKTLGVRGWLRYSTAPQVADARWIQAEPSTTPQRLAEALSWSVAPAADGEPGAGTSSGSGPRLLVIDDAHLLPAGCLHEIDHRLSASPETLKLVLLSRWDLPLTRLVPELLGDFTVIRGDVLLMDDEESAELIGQHARTTDTEVVKAITDQARGWCAAVVLASRAVASDPDPVTAARRLADRNTPVADRVAGDVFAALSARQRHLLLCLSGERMVSSSLAAHLAHDPMAADSLAELETTGLLVTQVPADRGRPGERQFQIHPLLAEVVRRRIVAGGVDVARARGTVVRAVRLDVAAGRTDGAFTRLVSVGAMGEAADVLAHDGVRMAFGHGAEDEVAELARAHPEAVQERPDTWFALALHRWVADDTQGARHWAERLIRLETEADAEVRERVDPDQIACLRLWRARLDLEPMLAAIGFAKQTLMRMGEHPDAGVRPVLVNELGIAQTWLGDLTHAEATFTWAINLGRSQGLYSLATSAMTHLALTEYMAGRESACVEVATDALASLTEPEVGPLRFSGSRGSLALFLGTMVDLPWEDEPNSAQDTATDSRVHTADRSVRFWMRMRDARCALMAGSVAKAEQILLAPGEFPLLADANLPEHFRVTVLLERAFLASLALDRTALSAIERELSATGARGEAALVDGLRADLEGDRRAAATAFATAAGDATFAQPPTRALALTCEAQLRDALGDHDGALGLLATAATECEVRRNAVPFLGWTHQGTPMQSLLTALERRSPTSWVGELAAASQGRPDVTAHFSTRTATPTERRAAPDVPMRPALSAREREVLAELARGSTYSDIAANLFVSENTVKTHVSSLYSKLGASKRSEALAIARSHSLL